VSRAARDVSQDVVAVIQERFAVRTRAMPLRAPVREALRPSGANMTEHAVELVIGHRLARDLGRPYRLHDSEDVAVGVIGVGLHRGVGREIGRRQRRPGVLDRQLVPRVVAVVHLGLADRAARHTVA